MTRQCLTTRLTTHHPCHSRTCPTTKLPSTALPKIQTQILHKTGNDKTVGYCLEIAASHTFDATGPRRICMLTHMSRSASYGCFDEPPSPCSAPSLFQLRWSGGEAMAACGGAVSLHFLCPCKKPGRTALATRHRIREDSRGADAISKTDSCGCNRHRNHRNGRRCGLPPWVSMVFPLLKCPSCCTCEQTCTGRALLRGRLS